MGFPITPSQLPIWFHSSKRPGGRYLCITNNPGAILPPKTYPKNLSGCLAVWSSPTRPKPRPPPFWLLPSSLATSRATANPNAAALHDLGLAAGNLSLEATARSLCVHKMIGILPDGAKETYTKSEGSKVLTALAIGVPRQP